LGINFWVPLETVAQMPDLAGLAPARPRLAGAGTRIYRVPGFGVTSRAYRSFVRSFVSSGNSWTLASSSGSAVRVHSAAGLLGTCRAIVRRWSIASIN
jgi:hypothetical protein